MSNITNVENIYGEVTDGRTAGTSATGQMMVSRQAQEVQAAMVVAKQFPRNERDSFERIMNACKRKSLAEQAMYEYPRGGTNVCGPSIRLAETVAQNWGNIDFGVMELEQKNGESQVMAYAWDLETNTRQTKIFTVPHIRFTKSGGRRLTDSRDIYELVANQGARRLRACILGVIPGDVIDSAIEQCRHTLSHTDVPLEEQREKMADIFEHDFGVSKAALESFIGMNFSAFTTQSLVRLRGVYRSLRDGMKAPEDYFDMTVDAAFTEVLDESANLSVEAEKEEQIDLKSLATEE